MIKYLSRGVQQAGNYRDTVQRGAWISGGDLDIIGIIDGESKETSWEELLLIGEEG